MFETLQAGIIVVKNKSINFMNKSFKQLSQKLKLNPADLSRKNVENILNAHLFQIYRKGEEGNESVKSSNKKMFSINDLL